MASEPKPTVSPLRPLPPELSPVKQIPIPEPHVAKPVRCGQCDNVLYAVAPALGGWVEGRCFKHGLQMVKSA